MDKVFIIIFGSLFVLIGLLSAAFFAYRMYQARSSLKWPFVMGELEFADISERTFTDHHGTRTTMVLDFKYHYTVTGSKFNGSRVTYTDGINKTLRALKKIHKRFQGKKHIKVFYNPEDPNQSVLVPGLGLFNFTPLITSTLFMLAGIYTYSLIL